MRKNFLTGAVAGACLLGTMLSAQAAVKPSIHWVKSLSEALVLAKQSHKLVMADMYTDWCGWCKKLDADTYPNKQVVQAADAVVSVKVNAEKEGATAAKKYGVDGFPTILFINESNGLEDKIVGYLPPDEFAKRLSEIVQVHKDFPALQARVKANPDDAEASTKLAVIYAKRGDADRATALLAHVETLDTESARSALPATYNSIADIFAQSQQFDKAIPLYQKAAKLGKDPKDIATAHLGIAVGYLEQNKMDEGRTELKALLAVPDAPKDMVATAHLYTALSYIQDKKGKDAVPELNAAIAVPGASAAIKNRAQEILKAIKDKGLDK